MVQLLLCVADFFEGKLSRRFFDCFECDFAALEGDLDWGLFVNYVMVI